MDDACSNVACNWRMVDIRLNVFDLSAQACQRLSVSSQIWCRQPSGRLSRLSSRITLNFP
jgi:hypothetical protein